MSNVSLSGIPSVSMPASPTLGGGEDGGGLNFGDVLQNAVSGVDSLNNAAGAQIGNLLQGVGWRHDQRDDCRREGGCLLPTHDAGAKQNRERLPGYREDAVLGLRHNGWH